MMQPRFLLLILVSLLLGTLALGGTMVPRAQGTPFN